MITIPSIGKETEEVSKDFDIKGWNKEGFAF
jgi:hypothetical protein